MSGVFALSPHVCTLLLQCISSNNTGDMLLKVKSEMASVSVSFKDLLQANWSKYAGPSDTYTYT